MRDVAARRVRVVEVTTTQPSPFAQSLLFGYTAQFLYDGDAPLAERRAAALTLDPTLLAELLGQGGESQLADLLDPDAVVRTEAELSGRAPERQAGSLEQVADVVRRHGPLSTRRGGRTRAAVGRRPGAGLAHLARGRPPADPRPARRRAAERAEQWAAVEDAGRLRDALGVALPGRRPRGVHRGGAGPRRRPAAPARPHARAVHGRVRGGPVRLGRGDRHRGPAAARAHGRPRAGSAAARRPGRHRRRVLRRRRAAPAASAVAGGAARRGRAGRATGARRVPAAVAGRAPGRPVGARLRDRFAARASTASRAWSNSSPDRCCPRRRSRRTCCRPACPTTSRRCWTS